MHPSLERLRDATIGTPFEGDLWLVGGAVRDQLLGKEPQDDFDLVTRGSTQELVEDLFARGLLDHAPVVYARFGTAMVRIDGAMIELVTARKESYDPDSRKPHVVAATLEDDARRRDFTCNALLQNLHTDVLYDPLGNGRADLEAGILRTPLDPLATFQDDPLRMLRAVRFRWKLGFEPAPGLYDAIRQSLERLDVVSIERSRDEILKMIAAPTAPEALQDLMDLGILGRLIPEVIPMVDCEQGKYHYADVWVHTLAVVKGVADQGDPILTLGALFHDIGKPPTCQIDANGDTRFFTHEHVGESMTRKILKRLRFPEAEVGRVASLVRHHMRLGSSPYFTPAAARRIIRDLGDQLPQLLDLVEADKSALRPGIKVMDLEPIRAMIERVGHATPRATLESPLTGEEVMGYLKLQPGPEVGRYKKALTEAVLDGDLDPGDKEGAYALLSRLAR